ncbi:MAG: hypothetical protein HS127_09315 [Planctomycetia bacterium]|nr:hypothetical protein [Planctomycetia bacterium]
MHQFDPWWTGIIGIVPLMGIWTTSLIFSAGIYFSPPSSPHGVIDSPAADVTINKGTRLCLLVRGDPDNNLPLSFRWKYGDGSGFQTQQ